MTDNEYLTLANKLYAAMNTAIFNGTLPECTISIVDENPEYIGRASAGTIGEITQRLDEIKKTGIAKTKLNSVIDLSRALFNDTDNVLPIAISTADTLLHEVIHILLWRSEDQTHGKLYQETAQAYGLDVELDKNGQYKNTHITMDTLIKILAAANVINKDAGIRQELL